MTPLRPHPVGVRPQECVRAGPVPWRPRRSRPVREKKGGPGSPTALGDPGVLEGAGQSSAAAAVSGDFGVPSAAAARRSARWVRTDQATAAAQTSQMTA